MNNLNKCKIIPETNNIHKIDNMQEKVKKIEQLKKRIVGKTYNEALKIYNNLRIVKIDDTKITVVLNFCQDRCNVIVKNNIITEIDDFY
jgi:hypothetical protein